MVGNEFGQLLKAYSLAHGWIQMAFVFGASCVQLGGHNEPPPTRAPSTGCPLLLSYG
jgi:3-deoxy-D-manno-octulosonic-acid transferase